ncbi:MAG: bifunctional UDP-N-acetylglucosamine diphosphorylase/glucosamine-1-phosphate N-acetyltransferase GlmU [Ideonella sp.]
MDLDLVIMAAGKGTRMKSVRPKVLHKLAGRTLLQHVLDMAAGLSPQSLIVVTGHGADEVEARTASANVQFVRQIPQHGTGHAVQQAVPLLHDNGTTLILNGDVPLIEQSTAKALLDACGAERLALLTVELADPTGYGRIVRDTAGRITGIVEHKDASDAQRRLREVYTGVMAAPTARLKDWLSRLTNNNAQREFYLTDIVAMAVADGIAVVHALATSETEVLGVNSPLQLAQLERRYQQRAAEHLMEAGVRLADPARFDLRGELLCGQDVEVDINCIFDGKVELADDVQIGANCYIRNARIGRGTRIQAFSHIDGDTAGVQIGENAMIGPFARLRPGADLGDDVHIGNFVEVKNSRLGNGSKANHLAYLGDSTLGERVNFGAGSITANYDGSNKHITLIGDDVHVGSNCVLVAPVKVGTGATIGAGSTVSKDAPAGQLTLARARQATLDNWRRAIKKR